ncbi:MULTISPECIES: response regulator transcription factor [Rhizobium]|uniref:response regulator transcription factor n=1 Tax=Rhizobium TaxID=379 RepID=UPI0007E5B4F2|nr:MULTISPECIES: response regulator transcription factor [Rhizobium]MBX4868379.1 response regulator transcription factor [Rhizobium bangladeshense]MBX4903297.1 response regulator transcription factor [Rhizobium bangladeshense]MBX4915011.1 response regulator transcription factor [Rhizobium bangladeshense]MBX4920089.1 response regulator transcription factor [Rhizobium bangladeshense]MBY3597660.1 response regulator transcription factor [Rhizobium bangladeshense]
MRILLIEDEPRMAAALRVALTRHDMVIDHVSTLCDAELVIGDGAYDALLLDRQLPDGDGLDLVPKIRRKGLTLPIIVITAKGEVPDRITGLETGADDYLAKPFVFDELLARLRAVMRRSETLRPTLISIGRLSFDPTYCDVSVSGRRLNIPRREALVLECLVRRAGRMVPRPTLMEAVFGFDDEIQSNALDSHISRLRRKLAASEAGVVINVIRGVGYLLREAS